MMLITEKEGIHEAVTHMSNARVEESLSNKVRLKKYLC